MAYVTQQPSPDLIQLQRRQKMAEQLLQQSQQPLESQMISGHYVGPSWTQSLARGLQGYNAKKELASADQGIADFQRAQQAQQQEKIANALKQFGQLANPSQAGTGPTDQVNAALPPEMQIGAQPQIAQRQPDLYGAYGALASSGVPELQQVGLQGIGQVPQIQAKKEEATAAREARAQQLQEAHALRMQAMQEQNASRQEMMKAQQDFQREMKAMGSSNAQPYFQPVQTAQGVMAFDARTGKLNPIGVNGQPIVGAQFDPNLQGALAGAKAGATTEAKAKTEARLLAPQAIAQADEAVKLVDDLLKAPGFKQAVGASRAFGIQKIPGTAAKDFDIRLDQLKGKQFLQAFESLKGGGQITEIEGKKATDAIARMDAAGSEEEFVKAAKEFQDVIRAGAQRAKAAAGGQTAPILPQQKPRMRFDAQGNLIQ